MAYLVCDCDKTVLRWQGKRAAKMIDAAIAKKKAEKPPRDHAILCTCVECTELREQEKEKRDGGQKNE